MEKKRSARRSDQTFRAREVQSESTIGEYTTPLAVAAGAIMAFPLVDDLTNMPVHSYIALAAFAMIIAVLSASLSESMRCSR